MSQKKERATMNVGRTLLRGALAIMATAAIVAPARATTLVRASMDELIATNNTIVVGEVVDTYSYWNDEGTFILTDARVAVHEVVKGKVREGELTLTLMGGTVGDLTTLIVAGAELISGDSYVLFLNDEDLPGAPGHRTVRDHCQGVYDIVPAADGLRAVSQANGYPLLPDASGYFDPPGGVEGFPLEAMIEAIREEAGALRR